MPVADVLQRGVPQGVAGGAQVEQHHVLVVLAAGSVQVNPAPRLCRQGVLAACRQLHQLGGRGVFCDTVCDTASATGPPSPVPDGAQF